MFQKKDSNTPHGPGGAYLGDPQHRISTHLNPYHALQLLPRTDMKPKPSSCISSVNPLFLFLPNQIKNRLETGEELNIGKLC